MSRPKVCYKCTERSQNCHSTCPNYANEVAKREKEKEAARKGYILPMRSLKKLIKYQRRYKKY